VRQDIWSTPRPVPGRVMPIAAAGALIVLALPVFLVAGFPLAGWMLAAVLWAASQAFALLLARLQPGADNLAASGVVGIGRMVRVIAVGVVLAIVASRDGETALAAALLFALAYTVELALSLTAYFTSEPVRR
jgi:hypothetical protein